MGMPVVGRRNASFRPLHRLLAWRIGGGSQIGDIDGSRRTVVSVSTQSGRRHRDDASTAIYVDREATTRQANALAQAISGDSVLPTIADSAGHGR
jgi:hypothetical protein